MGPNRVADHTPAPPITPELIAWLQKVYPHRIPDPAEDGPAQVWFAAGIQHVVQRLASKQTRQDGQ